MPSKGDGSRRALCVAQTSPPLTSTLAGPTVNVLYKTLLTLPTPTQSSPAPCLGPRATPNLQSLIADQRWRHPGCGQRCSPQQHAGLRPGPTPPEATHLGLEPCQGDGVQDVGSVGRLLRGCIPTTRLDPEQFSNPRPCPLKLLTLDSCPAKMTAPRMCPVLRRLHPRKSTLAWDRGSVAWAAGSWPGCSSLRLPVKVYREALGSSHSRVPCTWGVCRLPWPPA